LEARIQSARRASKIHKKRTGRALRITEQDVINEEIYAEEDDGLSTQYQRLNAHLNTTSVTFNKKLHDYILTQHGVRNMSMLQYQNPSYQQYSGQYAVNGGSFPQVNSWLNQSLLPPQQFHSSTPQGFQQAQPCSLNGVQQQQGFRQSPYHIPQRPQSYQRSLSIQLPYATSNFDPPAQQVDGGATTPQGRISQRMSLAPQAPGQLTQTAADGQSCLTLSRSPTAHSLQKRDSMSPQNAIQETPRLQNDADTPTSYTYSPATYLMSSQVLNTNLLTLSLHSKSRQLIGSALDPDDPRTAIFMSGSDDLPQSFAPTYTYNPNLSKSTRTTNASKATENPTGSA
jgi:hypothetical protein